MGTAIDYASLWIVRGRDLSRAQRTIHKQREHIRKLNEEIALWKRRAQDQLNEKRATLSDIDMAKKRLESAIEMIGHLEDEAVRIKEERRLLRLNVENMAAQLAAYRSVDEP